MRASVVLCVALACVAASGVSASAKGAFDPVACTFTSGSKTWDFSSLFNATAGAYRWSQTMYSADPSNVYDGADATAVPMQFELQVCGNAVTQHANCTKPSPINMISADGSCAALGSLGVSAWDANPYQDGAMVTYYHGDSLNHIQHYEGRIYFVCDPSQFGTPVYAEHMKTFFQWHFKFFTKLAC